MNFEKLNEAFDRRFSNLNEEDETKEVEKANKLPDACYSVNNTTGEVIIIKNGETGYYPTTYSFKGEKAKEFVKKANKELGVTGAQQHAMEIGSMFGWDVPGADPDNAINKKFNEGLVKNEAPKKFISESLSKEANSSKLSKFFDNFYGTFEFNGDEYRANKKNIKEWIEKHPSYKLLKEDACEYVDDEDIKDYKDGKIYFLKDEKKEVDEKLEVGQSYYLKFGSMEEADDALNKLHDRGFYAEKFDDNSPLVKVVGDDAGRDVTMAVIKELGLEQYVTEGLVDTAVSAVGTLTGHPIAGSIAGGVAQSVVDKLKANKEDKTTDIKEAYEGYTHDEVLDDLLDRVRLIKSENDGMSVEDAVERAIDDGLIYNKDILHLAEHYGVIDYSELLNNVYDYVFEELCSVYKDDMMDVDDSFDESKSSKTTNSLVESSSSEEFTYEVDGNEYKFVCTTVGTKEGFAHRAKLYKNGDILVSARCDYLNRTWETFRYQSCMRKAVEKAMRVHEELSDELSVLKRKIDGEDEQEVESPKMPNEDIKEALNKRITTLSKKQRTS